MAAPENPGLLGDLAMFGPKTGLVASLLLAAVLLAGGCATTDQKIDLIYESTGVAKGGYGDFFLTRDAQLLTNSVKVLGEIKDRDGTRIANVITDVAPADLVLDAFIQEMEAAGYRVKNVKELPAGVKKGLRIAGVRLRLDEVSSRLDKDASCSVRLAIEPWRDGTPMSEQVYQAAYSSQSFWSFGSDYRLLKRVMLKTLQDVMTQASPAVVRMIEQQQPVH